MDVNQPYGYRPLNRAKREIRLVHIKNSVELTSFTHDPVVSDLLEKDEVTRANIEKGFPVQCSIVHASLDDKPAYIALSYTWGDFANRQNIYVTDDEGTITTLQVTRNLYAALRHIRLDLLPGVGGDAFIWIDAICINQDDDEEKGWQVQQMLSIYHSSLNVLLWLGPKTDGSAEFVDEMDASFSKFLTWVRGQQNADINSWDLNKEFHNLLGATSFVHQPYWRRVWIQQEVYAKPFANVWLQWGPKIINLSKVYVFMVGMKTLYTTLRRQGLQSIAAVSGSVTAADLCPIMESHEYEMLLQTIYRTNDSVEAHALLTLVNLLGIIHVVGYGLQASDPRDHIFGLLNMASDNESLELIPNYTASCETVFINTAMALIKKGEIVILGWTNAFGPRPAGTDSTGPNLPSWAPDWRFPIASPIGAFTQFFTAVQIEYHAGRQKSLCTARFVDSKINSDTPTLSSYGAEIATVLSVSSILTRKGHQLSDDDKSEPLNADSSNAAQVEEPTKHNKHILCSLPQSRWFAELEALVHLAETTFESPQDARESAWRVPIGDVELTVQETYQRASEDFKGGYSLVHDRYNKQSDTTDQPPSIPTAEEVSLTSRYWEIMDTQSRGRRYFLTNKGHLGIGPAAMAPGDAAVVLLALNTPLILRAAEEGHYRIVGEAYVNGMMDGQVFEGDYGLREFLIV